MNFATNLRSSQLLVEKQSEINCNRVRVFIFYDYVFQRDVPPLEMFIENFDFCIILYCMKLLEIFLKISFNAVQFTILA